jgi:saccharopepsin
MATDTAEILNAEIGATKSWNGQYSVDCEKVKDLPPLTFYIDGKPFKLEGKDYVLEVQGSCISSFSGINLPGPLADMLIVGDVFLRKYYSVYDLGRNAVGLAEAK